jgi:hypothetical protein
VRMSRLGVGVLLSMALLGASLCEGASAFHDARATSAARSMRLDESGNLRLSSKRGFTLYERGQASGTVLGTLYVRLTIVSTSRVTVTLTLDLRGGSISGSGSASYRRGASSASFAGSISIDHGSGAYEKASGAGLSFDGAIQRANDAISVHVSGNVTV